MRIYDIIKKKRDNHALTKEEINFFVEKYSKEYSVYSTKQSCIE